MKRERPQPKPVWKPRPMTTLKLNPQYARCMRCGADKPPDTRGSCVFCGPAPKLPPTF